MTVNKTKTDNELVTEYVDDKNKITIKYFVNDFNNIDYNTKLTITINENTKEFNIQEIRKNINNFYESLYMFYYILDNIIDYKNFVITKKDNIYNIKSIYSLKYEQSETYFIDLDI
jgi:hypothetical protein